MSAAPSGYSKDELDDAQERFGLRFPPDLIELLRRRRIPDGYDWTTDDEAIRKRLEWPFEMLWFDVQNGFWWPGFGDRPPQTSDCKAVLHDFLSKQPRLIPLFGHRFLPETPAERGNPVFSMYGFDTILYGANLEQWLGIENDLEYSEVQRSYEDGAIKHIPFWSEIALDHETPYKYYQAANPDEFA